MTLRHRVGKCTWFDLPAHHIEDAKSFYEGLFGWQFLRLSDDAVSNYWIIQSGDELIGGLRQSQIDRKAGNVPILYFTVTDLQSASARVRDLGGKLEGQRIDLGKNRGSYQWFRDREGNLVALWAPSTE